MKANLQTGLIVLAYLLGEAGVTEFDSNEYGGLDIHENLIEAARDYEPYARRPLR
jgi:hypothetical protein